MKHRKSQNVSRYSLMGILFFMILFLVVGCGKSNPPHDEEGIENTTKLNVVTTFYPIYEFASQVAGENADVTVLLQAGQETHNYEPSPKDMAAIYDADVFIYSSEYMETWVPTVLNNLTESDVRIIEAAQGIPFYEEKESDEEEHSHQERHHHAVDPHVWLDPNYASQMVQTISEGLQAQDEEHAENYKKNAEAYQENLQQLDKEFQNAFSEARNRTFVVQHAAFGYLARRYDLKEVSLSSLTSEQEISPAVLAEMGEFIHKNHIQTIYYQDSSSSKAAETLADETDTNLEILHSIEGVTKADQKKGINYLSLMRSNLKALNSTIQ